VEIRREEEKKHLFVVQMVGTGRGSFSCRSPLFLVVVDTRRRWLVEVLVDGGGTRGRGDERDQ